MNIRKGLATKDFKVQNLQFDIEQSKKLLKSANNLFDHLTKMFVGTTEYVDSKMVSYELLAALMEMYPQLVMKLKKSVDD